jgi:hypothetical protein
VLASTHTTGLRKRQQQQQQQQRLQVLVDPTPRWEAQSA